MPHANANDWSCLNFHSEALLPLYSQGKGFFHLHYDYTRTTFWFLHCKIQKVKQILGPWFLRKNMWKCPSSIQHFGWLYLAVLLFAFISLTFSTLVWFADVRLYCGWSHCEAMKPWPEGTDSLVTNLRIAVTDLRQCTIIKKQSVHNWSLECLGAAHIWNHVQSLFVSCRILHFKPEFTTLISSFHLSCTSKTLHRTLL